ncbi:hypothetical protein DMUE_3508 [Dictyocoela muelleri]|nr:hypothetical protein DMUE_3508 [Dictyocoela muelleri]
MKELTSYKTLVKYIEGCPSFKIHKNRLMCVFCSKNITYNPKEGTKTINRHLTTKSHIENVNRKRTQQVLESTCNLTVINETYDRKLVEAFAAANIPLYKLQTPILRGFLEEYTNIGIRDESFYRKLLVPIFHQER